MKVINGIGYIMMFLVICVNSTILKIKQLVSHRIIFHS